MSSFLHTLTKAAWAVRELGLRQVSGFGIYRLGLAIGHYRRSTPPPAPNAPAALVWRDLWPPDDLSALSSAQRQAILAEADDIAAGRVRLYGGPATPLDLSLPPDLPHWTAYETGHAPPPAADIKDVWEPARFGWVFPLGWAYQLRRAEPTAQTATPSRSQPSKDVAGPALTQPQPTTDDLPAVFWRQAEIFLDANPPYLGPNWISAQEVALRLVAWTYALQRFKDAPASHPARQARLAQAIAHHAQRIPLTLIYARAQHNNHYLSEAAGLLTAGLALPHHPQAQRWLKLGWAAFQEGLLAQIAKDGSYSQHSVNYHRLALHLAGWVDHLRQTQGWAWRPGVAARLAAAQRWLAQLCDPLSGGAPNLGPNDGANIFPCPGQSWFDYRSVGASLAAPAPAYFFTPPNIPGAGSPPTAAAFPAGAPGADGEGASANEPISPRAWPVEMQPDFPLTPPPPPVTPVGGGQWKLTHPHLASWAVLRAARLAGRPGHADQLHVDIWRDGRNLALDPGAYRYNAPPPWDNALRQAQVHNTVTIDHLDQMQAAGRFLYLHRAQAEVLQVGETSLTAQHNGYRTLGLIHRRTLSAEPNGWRVIDEVLFASLRHARRSAGRPRHVAVQWLFPDAAWRLDGQVVRLDTPTGVVSVTLACDWPAALQIVRAGVSLFGSPHVQPIWGWYSPTYSVKIPGLCLRWVVQAPPPLTLVSHITLEGLSPG